MFFLKEVVELKCYAFNMFSILVLVFPTKRLLLGRSSEVE